MGGNSPPPHPAHLLGQFQVTAFVRVQVGTSSTLKSDGVGNQFCGQPHADGQMKRSTRPTAYVPKGREAGPLGPPCGEASGYFCIVAHPEFMDCLRFWSFLHASSYMHLHSFTILHYYVNFFFGRETNEFFGEKFALGGLNQLITTEQKGSAAWFPIPIASCSLSQTALSQIADIPWLEKVIAGMSWQNRWVWEPMAQVRCPGWTGGQGAPHS